MFTFERIALVVLACANACMGIANLHLGYALIGTIGIVAFAFCMGTMAKMER